MKKDQFNPIQEAEFDELIVPEIGNWGEIKYKLVGNYCNIFTTAMKNKWGNLVYIDLFSGAGHAKIKQTGKIIKTSPLIALNLKNKFTHYIFSELDKEKHIALKTRIKKHNPDASYHVFNYDSNEKIDEIRAIIPSYAITKKGTLSFCFLDPFSLNLHFKTVVKLAENNNKVDFLILLALQMDARRNVDYYLNEENNKIELFLDDKNWRNKFEKKYIKKDFMRFLADEYDNKMMNLGYQKPPTKHEIKTENNLSLYYLAFYSKHPLGNDFYKKIKESSTEQYTLF
jgi:three-Cys-motif partner protein